MLIINQAAGTILQIVLIYIARKYFLDNQGHKRIIKVYLKIV